jgi:hypothetical protein
MRSLRLVAVGVLGLLLALPGPAAALNLDEWVPGLKLSPFFTEQVDYESNVFQVPSHEQGSTIFRTSPGFLADYTFGLHSLSVGGRADILRYVALPAQNTVNYAGVTQLRLEFPRSLLNVRDDVIRTTDPPNSELTGPIVSLTNTLLGQGEYHLTDRFSIGALASWIHVTFQEQTVAQDLDRNEYLFGGSVFWKVLPRADLQLTPFFQQKIFILSSDRNVTQYGATLGLRGQVTAKITSSFRIGILNRDPSTSGQPGYLGAIMGGDITYKPTERTTVTLTADRSPQESSFNDVPFYVTTNGTLSVSQQITSKLTVTAKAGGGLNNYPEKQETVSGQFEFRRDTFYAFGISADYAIQPWLDVGVGYSYMGRNSNFDQYNFKDNRVSARLTLHF